MGNVMRILFIGDIVGKPGRVILRRALRPLVERHRVDLVIANVENAAGGFGITREIGESIRELGVDVMTSGNHVWDRKEALDYIGTEPRLLRPANYPAGTPGLGRCTAATATGDPVAIINVMGRIFMQPLDNPFDVVLQELDAIRAEARVVIVDFHAEATSEKIAMGWHLDGKVTAVIGTHTHVQTADARVLPNGTACITDVGMTGPHRSVIGVDTRAALSRFVTGLPTRFETATEDTQLHAVVVTADPQSGLATEITPLSVSLDDVDALVARPVTT